MTTPADMVARHEYRLALVHRDRRRLFAIPQGNAMRLPRVTIPPNTRFAEQLTRAIKEQWGFDSVVLDLLPDGLTSAPCAVIEIRSPETQIVQDSLFIVDVEAIDPADLMAGERRSITALLSGAEDSKGPFCGLGWLDNVISWIGSEACKSGLKLTGKFRQLNCGGSFSLIRFETNSVALWFKAVGEPNLREFAVSVALAKFFPHYVPSLLAIHPEWNGWLTLEAPGSTLNENSDFNLWVGAARTLASLQIESRQRTNELLEAGCRDVKTSALLDHVDGFFEIIRELMQLQPKTPPRILDRHELRALASEIKDACSRLGELALPDTLGHLDFNLGNVLVSHDGCTFLDWAEAYVGHPFLTFEYFLEHFRRLQPGDISLESKLKSSYTECWRSMASNKELNDAVATVPLVAAFAYAVASCAWKDVTRLQNPRFAGYFRSLTRRMQHELQVAQARRCDA